MKNLDNAINTMYVDEGKLVNNLISRGLITVDEVTRRVIATKDARLVYNLARYINGVNISDLALEIMQINSAKYMYKFARYVKDAPIERLALKVAKTKDAKYIYKFAKYIPDAPIKKLAVGVVATLDPDFIYLFAKDVKEAPISFLAEGLILTKRPEYMYYFLRDVEGIPKAEKDILVQEVINCNALFYMTFIAIEQKEYRNYLVDLIMSRENIVYIAFLIEHIYDIELRNSLKNKLKEILIKNSIMELPEEERIKYLMELYYSAGNQLIGFNIDVFKAVFQDAGRK